jgi:hypothetical protein
VIKPDPQILLLLWNWDRPEDIRIGFSRMSENGLVLQKSPDVILNLFGSSNPSV